MIQTKELYWSAGFLEGEGSVSYNTTVRMTACQVQLEPLSRLRGLFGGAICLSKMRDSKIFAWALQGINAAGLLMTIYPLMSPRRKLQFLHVLARWRAAQVSTKYRLKCKHGHPFDSPPGAPRSCSICHRAHNLKAYKKRRRT